MLIQILFFRKGEHSQPDPRLPRLPVHRLLDHHAPGGNAAGEIKTQP